MTLRHILTDPSVFSLLCFVVSVLGQLFVVACSGIFALVLHTENSVVKTNYVHLSLAQVSLVIR